MAKPLISAKKEGSSYNERVSYSVERDLNGTFQLLAICCTIVQEEMPWYGCAAKNVKTGQSYENLKVIVAGELT